MPRGSDDGVAREVVIAVIGPQGAHENLIAGVDDRVYQIAEHVLVVAIRPTSADF